MWTHLYKNFTDPRLCLAFIMKEKGQLEVQDREARSPKGKLLRRQTEQAASKSSSAQSFACPKCNRVCASKIGLLKAPTGMPRWPSAFPNPCLRGVSHRHISFFFFRAVLHGFVSSESKTRAKVHLTSAQDGIYALGKAHTRSTPSPRGFPNLWNGSNVDVADDVPFSSFWGGSSIQALALCTPLRVKVKNRPVNKAVITQEETVLWVGEVPGCLGKIIQIKSIFIVLKVHVHKMIFKKIIRLTFWEKKIYF